MKDTLGLYYHPQAGNPGVRVYVRREPDGSVAFRLWRQKPVPVIFCTYNTIISADGAQPLFEWTFWKLKKDGSAVLFLSIKESSRKGKLS